MLYLVIFKDNTSFEGGNIYDTKWNQIPNKKIKRIIYSLSDGNYLTLSNYDKYYHYVEALNNITGADKGQIKLQHACIMGLKDNKITCYTIILSKENKTDSIYKFGDIIRREYNIDDVRIKALNKKGWK